MNPGFEEGQWPEALTTFERRLEPWSQVEKVDSNVGFAARERLELLLVRHGNRRAGLQFEPAQKRKILAHEKRLALAKVRRTRKALDAPNRLPVHTRTPVDHKSREVRLACDHEHE